MIVIAPKDVPTVWISPVGFHFYGAEFLRAAKSYKKRSRYSPVKYYLYCHSIEVLLKAYLMVKSVSLNDLKYKKRYGHNLQGLLKEAKSRGLDQVVSVTPAREREIAKANGYYYTKGFEYLPSVFKVAAGYPDLPRLSVLSRFAGALVEKLEPICLAAS